MTKLYSHNGSFPAHLPHLIWLSDGRPRTSQTPFTPEEIADAGYVEAPPEPTYDAATQRLGWDGANWTVEELPPPPEQDLIIVPPQLYAAAQLRIENGEVTGIGINSRLAGAFILDVGKYFVMFYEAMPDVEYMAMPTAIGPCSAFVHPSEKFTDGFLITVINAAGEPVDAEAVNVTIVRA